MAPTLLDCWACRDLQRFRAVLKGTSNNGQSTGGGGGTIAFSPRSPVHRSVGGNATGPCPPAEVNRRDHLGRAVLHLIASCTEPAAVDWLVAVLAHPSTNVNVGDGENGWTPLHRALYHGNLLTAQLLLRRTTGSGPADARLKDLEGLTPYDLYNSTVAGSAPARIELVGALVLGAAAPAGELFAWGANRNYSLGHGDGADRALPDRVRIDRIEETLSPNAPPGSKYERIGVRDVGMSKFATIVLTDEKSANVRCAGVGSVGRIGRAPQMQTKLEPLRDFTETAAALAVGPDHTCIVTTTGALYTFGHNRFQQLGYALEHGQGVVASSTASKGTGGAASATFGANATTTTPASELDVQLSPRRVAGALKKEQLIGSAAGKLHSAAFSAEALYTWGTNTGQLGYDRAASPVQVSPRKVTALASGQIVRQVAVTDFATACLLATGDVLLLHNDAHFIVRFPQPGFSSNMSVFQPRQAIRKPLIKKVTAGAGNLMAAISDMGDVFTFSLGHPSEYAQSAASAATTSAGGGAARQAVVKPQLVWSVRKNKKVGAAEYVALGGGSDIILTTESGHVFVRSRPQEGTVAAGAGLGGGGGSTKGKSGWKAVPLLQRIVKVATNESGGFAAIKADALLRDIRPRGRSLEEDLLDLLPHLKAPAHAGATQEEELSNITAEMTAIGVVTDPRDASDEESEEDSDAGESSTERHVRMAQLIGEAARRLRFDKRSLDAPPFGTDAFIIAGGRYLPTHRAVLAARIPSLARALASPARSGLAPAGVIVQCVEAAPDAEDAKPRSTTVATIELPRCSFHTALLLLHYLYSDDLPAIWTASVGLRISSSSKVEPTQVRAQLHELAKLLDIPALTPSLSSPVPRAPSATLRNSLYDLFVSSVAVDVADSLLHDVELRLADRVVPAHSALLRRSPFFATLLQPHWTLARWNDGILSIDMSHIRWDVAKLVLLHLYTDTSSAELFRGTDAERSADEWIDFVTEVMAAANEMLLDKLKLLCCALLRRRVTPTNVASLLSDAEFYHALALKDATMDYSARTLETLLEGGMLEDLEVKLVRDLTRFVRQRQDERMHRTQASDHVAALIIQHQEYYDSLDIPPPSLNLVSTKVGRRPPRSTPLLSSGGRGSLSPCTSPELRPVSNTLAAPTPAADGGFMFSMDEDEDAAPASAASATPWRVVGTDAHKAPARSSTPRTAGVDLRSIMASEQATRRPSGSTSGSAVASGAATPVKLPPSANADVVSLNLSSKLSQRYRKKQLQMQQQAQAAAVAVAASSPSASATTWSPTFSSLREATPSTSSAGTPTKAAWKTPEAKPGMQAVPPFSLDAASPTRSSVRAPRTSLEGAISGTPLSPLGPTFAPQRGVARPAQKRVVSGESAWGGAALTSPSTSARPVPLFSSSPQLRPIPSPSPFLTPSPSNTPPIKSFAAIQAEEQRTLEATAAAQASAKKTSFAQLIEEDRKANEQREKEERDREAFEAWFEEEAKRLRIEDGSSAPREGGAKRGAKGKKPANGAVKEKGGQPNGKKDKRAPKDTTAGPSQSQEGTALPIPTGPKNSKPRNNGGGGANRGKPRGSTSSRLDASGTQTPAPANGAIPPRV